MSGEAVVTLFWNVVAGQGYSATAVMAAQFAVATMFALAVAVPGVLGSVPSLGTPGVLVEYAHTSSTHPFRVDVFAAIDVDIYGFTLAASIDTLHGLHVPAEYWNPTIADFVLDRCTGYQRIGPWDIRGDGAAWTATTPILPFANLPHAADGDEVAAAPAVQPKVAV